MRKDRLYFFTFISITIIYIIISSLTFNYLVKKSTHFLLETHIDFSKKEAQSYATLVGEQIKSGISKEVLADHIRESVSSADYKIGFLSIYDWSGKVIAHPDIKKVGLTGETDNYLVSSVQDNITVETLYEAIHEDIDALSLEEANTNASKVIHLLSIENSDWILAANLQIGTIASSIKTFKRQFFIAFLVMGLFVVLSSVIILRWLGSAYEKRFELKNEQLETEVINLSKLNRAIENRQKVDEEKSEKQNEDKDKESSTKTRILTYVRNELVPISTNDIAYIYTENTITYVVSIDGKRSTSNISLDELINQLDETYFFRANRQFIIAISSIDKIVKYGNSQLKILITPESETSIIISKNKAAQFKQWLNK